MSLVALSPLIAVALSACGGANGADCSGNVAKVGSIAITTAQFNAQLRYTLGFYEHGNAGSRYFGINICHSSSTAVVCRSIKMNMVSRMIDQELVSAYAAAHNLLATAAEWNKALQGEARLRRNAGGPAAWAAYLTKVGTDPAQFRFLESQQIETANVIRAMGPVRFHQWLHRREASKSVTRCPMRA